MGYTADVAANGQEALDALRRQRYDVILMDVQMPVLDGLETARRIRREWPATQQPWIVAMTANAMQGDRELCLEAGMDDYVSKPVYLEELHAALQRVGQRGTASDEILLDPVVVAQVRAQRMARELIELYVAEAEQLLDHLASAVAQGDAVDAQRVVHGLKSSSHYVGAVGMADLSQEFEALLRDSALAHAPPMMAELRQRFERTRELLLNEGSTQ